MRKILTVCGIFVFLASSALAQDCSYSIKELAKMGIVANSPIQKSDLEKAKEIMLNVQAETAKGVKNGKGPFYAEIYDKDGKLVVASSNSVVADKCCLYHAEVNTIKKAHQKFGEYNLAPEDLTIYVNAEPCIMCAGAIMWSGIKTVYFGVPSSEVERITGFDEGYKPNWIKEFKKRGITVYGNIEQKAGEKVLEDYVTNGHEIYRPSR